MYKQLEEALNRVAQKHNRDSKLFKLTQLDDERFKVKYKSHVLLFGFKDGKVYDAKAKLMGIVSIDLSGFNGKTIDELEVLLDEYIKSL